MPRPSRSSAPSGSRRSGTIRTSTRGPGPSRGWPRSTVPTSCCPTARGGRRGMPRTPCRCPGRRRAPERHARSEGAPRARHDARPDARGRARVRAHVRQVPGSDAGVRRRAEPGYIAWIVRTLRNRPDVVRHARVVLAHLEASGWRDTPRPPREQRRRRARAQAQAGARRHRGEPPAPAQRRAPARRAGSPRPVPAQRRHFAVGPAHTADTTGSSASA